MYTEDAEYQSSTYTPNLETYFEIPASYHSLIYLFLVEYSLRSLDFLEN